MPKISELTDIGTADALDIIVSVDVSASATRKMSLAQARAAMFPPSYVLTGITASDYYDATANTLVGNAAGFTASVMFRMIRRPTDLEVAFGNFELFQPLGGWFIGCDTNRFKFGVGQQGTSGVDVNFGGGAFFDDGFDPLFFLIGSVHVLTIDYDGTDANCYINGYQDVTITPPSGYEVSDSSNQPMIGRNNNATQQRPSPSLQILGCGYVETSHATADVADHSIACHEAGSFVDGGIGWSNMWSFKDEATAPATLLDSVGSANFTRQGTPATVEIKV